MSPHSSRRTTLLNTKVLNLCIRQVADGVRRRFGTWQHGNPFYRAGCQSKWCISYYRINLLAQKLLQAISWISHAGFFVFQNDRKLQLLLTYLILSCWLMDV